MEYNEIKQNSFSCGNADGGGSLEILCSCESACGHDLCVRKVPIFSSLDQGELVKISELIRHTGYSKGEVLLSEGDKPDRVFIINKGSAKAFTYTSDGREQILYVFSEGDFFGEQYLLGNRTAAYRVEALEPLQACLLMKRDFHSLLKEYPDIAVKIIESLDDRLALLEQSMQSMGVRSVDARIASLLLHYADKYGTSGEEGIQIRLPLSREGMANHLGIARETVSRKLGQMENDHLIRPVGSKTILLLDRAALEVLSGSQE